MTRTHRHSKRQRKKAERRAKRKEARKNQRNGSGHKAGSIAIHSRLPGLEGTLIGSMDVVVDTRRTEEHPSEITVAIHQRVDNQIVVWSIETGFGGQIPRVGFKVIPDSSLDEIPPIRWFPDVESAEIDDRSVVDAYQPADVLTTVEGSPTP